jgi:hypothetical protein
MRVMVGTLAVAALGCQHDIHTPFIGLEPLEHNPIPEQTSGPYSETLQTSTDDSGYIHVYGRGFVHVDAAKLWQLSKNPEALVAKCSTDGQAVTPNDEPKYEYSFVVHYTVHDVLTVQWDDAYRFGVLAGADDAPELGMIKHQKINGSSFISLSAGTIQVTPTLDDTSTSELAFVEHLNAEGSSDSDVVSGVRYTYAALLALAHGQAIPPCP